MFEKSFENRPFISARNTRLKQLQKIQNIPYLRKAKRNHVFFLYYGPTRTQQETSVFGKG